MKRRLKLSILLVLVATVISLTVALGFWWYSTKNNIDIESIEIGAQEVEEWRARRQPDWSLDPQNAYISEHYGITFRGFSWHYEEWQGSPGDVNYKNLKLDSNMIFINEFGWPLRCIADERWFEAREPEHEYQSSEMFIVFGAHAPNRVLWTGMFINVLYYSFSIALAFLCWSYIRRGVRRMRGLCIKCGYDLRETPDKCPECGWGREAEA